MMLFFVSQYFFMQSPLFEHHEVKVEGADRVSTAIIEKKLGLADNANYWNLSSNSLEQNLSSLYMLEKATVQLRFPGQVNVHVTERTPNFYVAYTGDINKWYSVDDSGVVLERATPQKGHLKFILSQPVKGGAHVRLQDLQVVRYFRDRLASDLADNVSAIRFNEGQQVSIKTTVGKRPVWVKLGRPERLDYKLFLLGELLSQLSKERSIITSIDLRYSAPVVKKKPLPSVQE